MQMCNYWAFCDLGKTYVFSVFSTFNKTRLGVPSIAGRLLKVIETCVYDLRHEKGAHCR